MAVIYYGLCKYHSENWKLLGSAVYSYTSITNMTYYILASFKNLFKSSISMAQQCWNMFEWWATMLLCMLCANLVGLLGEYKLFATNHLHTCCRVHLMSAVVLLMFSFISENLRKILPLLNEEVVSFIRRNFVSIHNKHGLISTSK
jgi:hypothetical protein